MAWLIGVQPPLPQAARAIDHAHGAAGAQVAPCLVALPPAGRPAAPATVFVGRLAVRHTFGWRVAPHVGYALGYMFAAMTGLAPLEVEPGCILVGAIVGVRAIVNTSRLAVGIPVLDLCAARRHLRLVA